MKKLSILSDQRRLGFIIITISIILFFVIFSLAQTITNLRLELHKACPLEPELCPYKSSVPNEVLVAYTTVAILGSFGVFITFVPRHPEKSFTAKRFKQTVKTLQGEEKKVYGTVAASDGFIFQSDLAQKTGFSKVKVTRVLDKLEAKGLLERRRRGMANIVILKS